MLRDLQPLIATWRPDLVIHDTAELAGAIAAEAAGVAHVEHSFGILRPAIVRAVATEILAPIAARLGVRNPGISGSNGELYLDICPPGIQQPEIAEVPNVQRLRPGGFDGGPDATLPAWVADLPARPTIYVTMGTVFNKSAEVFATVLDGLRDEDVNVIVTVGETGDPALLGPAAGPHPRRAIHPAVATAPPLRPARSRTRGPGRRSVRSPPACRCSRSPRVPISSGTPRRSSGSVPGCGCCQRSSRPAPSETPLGDCSPIRRFADVARGGAGRDP